jgi:hypothetical protein
MDEALSQRLSSSKLKELNDHYGSFMGIMQLPYSEEFLKELGHAIANYSRLEETITNYLVWLTSGMDGGSIVLISQLAFRSLLDCVKTIDNEKYGVSIDMSYLHSLADDATITRNSLVHSLWWPYPDEQTAGRVKNRIHKHVHELEQEQFTAEDMRQVAEYFKTVGDMFQSYVMIRQDKASGRRNPPLLQDIRDNAVKP